MITATRLVSQQLANPMFNTPKDLVTWMGAIQAQEYSMAKWAIGMRIQSGNLQTVDDALREGKLIRTHVMRPTWHIIAAEDTRWMLKLSFERNKAAYDSYAKGRNLDITENEYGKCSELIGKVLQGNRHLTKQELGEEFSKAGFKGSDHHVTRFISRAEIEGIICSGIDKGKNMTYALLDERIPPAAELVKEEALAKLAGKYFRSHSPASLQDFIWWSGLRVAEARQAVDLIKSKLITDTSDGQNLLIHESYKDVDTTDDLLHFLPSYDEFLISYKDRTATLPLEHQPKAFNSFGIFYPVILHNGNIVGNWKKVTKKKELSIETSFFDPKFRVKKALLDKAEKRYINFHAL